MEFLIEVKIFDYNVHIINVPVQLNCMLTNCTLKHGEC